MVAGIQLTYVVQLFLTGGRGKLRFAILGFFSLIMSLSLLVPIGQSALTLQNISGIYLIVYGLWQLMDMVGILINRNTEESLFLSSIRLKPPVLLTSFLPSIVLRKMRNQYQTLTADIEVLKPSVPLKSYDDTLDIFFHLGDDVAFGFGHVDISIGGKTYSYGCYNEKSNRFGGLVSDGVILCCDTKPYIHFGQEVEKKLLISFSLGLSQEDGALIHSELDALLHTQCTPWFPENASLFAPNAHFYTLKEGDYRFYNAFRTNCVAVAELIGCMSGLMLMPSNGFVTPGAYYERLQNELRDPKSNVLKQTIYANTQKVSSN